MKNRLVSCLILSSAIFLASPVFAGESPFKVQLYPDQVSVKTGMMFLVRAEVRNATEDTVDLLCHTCAFQKHWIVDTPGVFLQPWTCDEDEMETKTLESGEAYEKNLILYITKKDGPGPVTFRLGFVRVLENGDQMEPVWSDPVTIKVWAPEVTTPAVVPATPQTETPAPVAPVQIAKPVQEQITKPVPAPTIKTEVPAVEVSETMPDEAADADEPDSDVPPEIAKKIP